MCSEPGSLSDRKIQTMRDRLLLRAEARKAMVEKFGFVPNSIVHVRRTALAKRVFFYQRERPERRSNTTEKMKRIDRKMVEAGYARKWGVGEIRANNAFTMMPPDLVDFFIKFYAEPGQVYLDPFMGQGVQMQVAKIGGLDYYGYDLNEEFCAYIDAVREKIDDGQTVLRTVCGDSLSPDQIPNGVGDFCFTSPPYWDIEDYGPDAAQVGSSKTYEEFLATMSEIYRAWLPKFKPSAWIVINVNDFKKDGKFYPYHADTIRVLVGSGFEVRDCWVLGSLSSMHRIYAVHFSEMKMAPKNHEYALVFRPRGWRDAK